MLKAFVRAQNAAVRLQQRERGATAVEYGLMIALIAAVIIAIVTTLGGTIKGMFTTVNNGI